MQRGLGGFPHERLHQDGSREKGTKIIAIHLGLVLHIKENYSNSTTFKVQIAGF